MGENQRVREGRIPSAPCAPRVCAAQLRKESAFCGVAALTGVADRRSQCAQLAPYAVRAPLFPARATKAQSSPDRPGSHGHQRTNLASNFQNLAAWQSASKTWGYAGCAPHALLRDPLLSPGDPVSASAASADSSLITPQKRWGEQWPLWARGPRATPTLLSAWRARRVGCEHASHTCPRLQE